jgi:hypothetical protein
VVLDGGVVDDALVQVFALPLTGVWVIFILIADFEHSVLIIIPRFSSLPADVRQLIRHKS